MRRLLDKIRGTNTVNSNTTSELPFPPFEMRELVGPTDLAAFDNPGHALVYPFIPAEAYESFFDFGCGCGRVARQLMMQSPRPSKYLGVDLHRGMIDWDVANLAPRAPGFHFEHHDVYNIRFNPSGAAQTLPFPAGENEFSAFHALSVFTHLTESQAEHYLSEAARIITSDGFIVASWFVFDKDLFPMMAPETNAFYISYTDPSAVVLYARQWIEAQALREGLEITEVIPPQIRGHQWIVVMRPQGAGQPISEWPADSAPIGKSVPPTSRFDAHEIR